jgi:uncharacterized repeat protein (TIGR03803 family)
MRRSTSSCLCTLSTVLAVMLLSNASPAATESILHSFNLTGRGYQPSGGLIADSAGNLYGTTAWGAAYDLGAVYELMRNSHGRWTEKVLYSFKLGGDIYSPNGTLTFDAAGNLYGAASQGGTSGLGGIFELTPTSSHSWIETTLHNFTGNDGSNPNGGLVFDPSGNLYGTTYSGGGKGTALCINFGCGVVFRLSPGSNHHWSESVLYAFDGQSDGSNPLGNLALDTAGNLYGATNSGGNTSSPPGYGLVFELTQFSGTWMESVLYTFSGGTDGAYPNGGVLLSRSGNLYGAALGGGSSTGCQGNPCGVIFELVPGSSGTWAESVLYSFQGGSVGDGQAPNGPLSCDRTGNLYGTTLFGGVAATAAGTVFKLTSSSGGQWTETQLWTFTGGTDGGIPESGVTIRAEGQVYTTATKGGSFQNGTVIELTATSSGQWNEGTVTDFPFTGGGSPGTALIADASGNLYGTTSTGDPLGNGTVFKLTMSSTGVWEGATIYNFGTGLSGTPSTLILDSAGNLYGETTSGGPNSAGAIFELSPNGASWIEKTLYTFSGTDGLGPVGGLVFDQAGNLYGTTSAGGNTGCNCGTVFQLTPGSGGNWTETVLHSFAGASIDGANPAGGPILDASGNLYGTTQGGGSAQRGAVFKLTPGSGGWIETLLHSFTGANGDGAFPMANLVSDPAGNLYGTTPEGGHIQGNCSEDGGCGVVFKLSPSSGGWNETVLLSFHESDGNYPVSTLIFDSAGNLYGTTEGGLGNVWGTVFELSPASGSQWTETVLYIFPSPSAGTDGYLPLAGVIRDSLGNLYGTTLGGGQHNGGTVFEITP